MADAIVSALLQQLINTILQTSEHVLGFESRLDSMKLRLVHIKALLEVNDNQQNESAAHEALAKFRNLMYEADDVLTDCLIRREYYTSGPFSNLLPHNLVFSVKTSMKIEKINTRMQEIDDILGKHLKVQVGSSSSNDAGDGIGQTHQTPSLDVDQSESDGSEWELKSDSNEIFGLESDVKTIKEWIVSSNYNLRKIGVVGMGGLGKTTIAKTIYNDNQVRSHFDKKIWVSVSQTFREDGILRRILQQLGEEFSGENSEKHSGEKFSGKSEKVSEEKSAEKHSGANTEEISGKGKLNQILSRLQKSSCLIVLDDIWDNKYLDWWKEKFFCALSKSAHKKSCIIITTRDQDVASGINVDKIHKPKVLPETPSWSLFSKHAFSRIHKDSVEVFEELGKNIVKKCAGLPLAIKTIGGLLGITDCIRKWEDICRNFCEHDITDENKAVMTSLDLSYKALPIHLKQCLLCFSVYPEDYVIQADKLIHWWVGEGLIQDKGRKTAIELGSEYLSKLVRRCLVEVVERRGYDGSVYSCKMHDLVRELTILKAQEEKICSLDNDSRQQLPQNSRWFGCTSAMGGKSLNRSPKLRALLLLTVDHTDFDRNLGSLCSLRVLDLSNNKLDKKSVNKLLSWISSLKRLAYLNLSGSADLEAIPHSICKLQNLQLLVLSGCTKLCKLSPSVTYLKRLVVLDLSACDVLPYLPRRLGMLSQLQELYGLKLVRQRNRESCSLLELGGLSNLRVLHMKLSIDSEIRKEEGEILSKHGNLKILTIDFDSENCKGLDMLEMLNKLCPPKELEELRLRHYYHPNLPTWFSPECLSKLLYLCIEDAHLVQMFKSAGKWRLQGMCLNVLSFLKMDWNDLKEKMPILRYAEISGCSNITNFPSNSGVWRRNRH